ncbi:MAG: SPFH domain-containing protein [Pseudomonadota bacterium]
MAIFNGLKRQLRSVIQWQDPDPNTLLYQWTDNGDEIKNASKLIVGPGQGCIFVYEGKIRYILEKEKLISLKTDNIPFWTSIKKFMQLFESEHKVGIYFYRRTKILDQKWGTTSPIKYDDPKYNFPVGLKAYGNYSYQIDDPRSFFVNIVGSGGNYYIDDFRSIMSDRIIHPLSDFLSESRFSYAEIDANRDEITAGMQQQLDDDFAKLGFKITDFRIEGTDFDENTLKRINRIADLTAEAHAAKAVGMSYAGVQQIEAMREAARNEGGAAGIGMGLGAGMGLGQSMAQSMGNNFVTTEQTSTPNKGDPMEKLTQLKKMYQSELINEQEYTAKKKDILDNI